MLNMQLWRLITLLLLLVDLSWQQDSSSTTDDDDTRDLADLESTKNNEVANYSTQTQSKRSGGQILIRVCGKNLVNVLKGICQHCYNERVRRSCEARVNLLKNQIINEDHILVNRLVQAFIDENEIPPHVERKKLSSVEANQLQNSQDDPEEIDRMIHNSIYSRNEIRPTVYANKQLQQQQKQKKQRLQNKTKTAKPRSWNKTKSRLKSSKPKQLKLSPRIAKRELATSCCVQQCTYLSLMSYCCDEVYDQSVRVLRQHLEELAQEEEAEEEEYEDED